jgi:glucosamine-6-phosphate deaminase
MGAMEVIIQPDRRQASLLGTRIIARLVREKPDAVLGFATGKTPLMLYQFLIQMHREQGLDFGRVTAFNLDEYIGLDPSHPASFHSYMWKNLFSHIAIREERVNIPNGMAPDIPAACREFEETIKSSGGIDIQILGIGRDGHIGFNEPSSSLTSRTRIKTLTAETRKDHGEDFGGEKNVPFHVITMGLGTIMESRTCLLLAFGKAKARPIAQTIEGPITAMVPASILQLHQRAIVLLDEEAATELKKTDYYRWVYSHKPDWQKY